jgi:hypothetical protein
MTKERQVRSTEEALSVEDTLKLALEALEWDYVGDKHQRKQGEAITAIKEALMSFQDGAQPEKEPVAWTDGDDLVLRQDWAERFDWQGSWVGVGRAIPNKWKPTLYTQPQPKAEQEPKREWVGLTDEEIMDVAFNFDVPSISLRTIEAKLKEKNT